MARTIGARLAELDPKRSGEYDRGLQAFLDRLDRAMFGDALVEQVGAEQLWEHQRAGDFARWVEGQAKADLLGGWQGRIGPHRGTKIVTFHRSFPYFAHRFGLDVIAELEAKPGIPPSPRHLVQVIRKMRESGTRLILMEPFYSPKPADLVARKAGGVVVKATNSVGGQEGVDDYFSLIDNLVQRVVDAIERKEP